jgi:hypothetical protein
MATSAGCLELEEAEGGGEEGAAGSSIPTAAKSIFDNL